jgi:lipoprotein-releasing system permease protein
VNNFSLLLALRYLRVAKPRSLSLYFIPLVVLALVGMIHGTDALMGHAHSARILDFHAENARLIGNIKWIGWFVFVLLFAFIAAIRHFTIFTTISTYGVFLGCAALILMLGVMSGFESDIKHKILGTHANIEVTRVDEAFTDWRDQLARVEKTPGVVAATPVLTSEAMISGPGSRATVIVRGIDPDTVGKVSDLQHSLELGDLDALAHPEHIKPLPDPLQEEDDDKDDPKGLDELRIDKQKDKTKDAAKEKTIVKLAPLPKPPPDAKHIPPGIILGVELAKTLHAYVGDDISMISPTGGIGPTGATPRARPYRVAGIFYTGMFEYDQKLVYVTLPSAQKLFDQEGEITNIDIKVKDSDDTDGTVAALGRTLGPSYEVNDWKTLNSSLFSALALEKVVIFIILSFIILVAAFSIVANGHMIASQKIAEIAILKSMGATDGTIATVFVLLGTLLGLLGVAAGVAGGLLGAFALIHWGYALDPEIFYMTQVPVRLEPHEIMLVAASGVIVTMLATVYPAFMASRMVPVEGLREGGR